MMNEFIGIANPKKELKRTFDIIDKQKIGRVRLEDIKSISHMIQNENGGDNDNEGDETVLPADELKLR
jgi:Ca2+-binding EF-hand superfamily protein